MLLLFDVDGTLLVDSDVLHFAAMRAALAEVFARPIGERDGVEKAGRTDFAIARDVAVAHGVSATEFERERSELARAWVAAFLRLRPPDLTDQVPAGMGEALAELESEGDTLTLVTGNLRPIAEAKLTAARLIRHFRPDVGAYGSDEEDRRRLPPLARARRGAPGDPWPRAETVLIGDTPRDIACARADAVRVLAVTTGHFDGGALDHADAVADRPDEVVAVLAAWRRAGQRSSR